MGAAGLPAELELRGPGVEPLLPGWADKSGVSAARYTWNVRTGRWTAESGVFELLGLDPGVELSKEILLARVHPADRALVVEVVEQALVSAQPFVCEHRIEQAPAAIRRVVITGEVLPDAAGRPLILQGAVVDVTERHRLEQQAIADSVDSMTSPAVLAAAAAIHRAALPAALAGLPGVRVAARYLPADGRLGGDVYDAWADAGGRVSVLVGDVAGHGLVAAGAMSRLSMMLRTFGGSSPAPGHVLAQVNRLHCAANAALATAVLVTLDPAGGVLRWASAGHPPPLLVSAGKVIELDGAANLLLGVDPDAAYSSTGATVSPGDRLVLFTDGLVERRTQGVDEGVARLMRAASQPWPDVEQMADGLLRALGAQDRQDDVCLLIAEITGEGPAR